MKKVNKAMSMALAVLMGASTVAGLTACGGPQGEKVDKTKTQIYIWNFGGGYGAEWLAAAKKRYEELHAEDTHWQEGKKGVQVMINTEKKPIDSVKGSVRYNKEDIYFAERAYYYTLLHEGVLGDMTEVVTGDNPYDNNTKTVESKLTKIQKGYYGVVEEGADGEETHYYGLPHYASYAGITYNVDLFDGMNYYFTATPDEEAPLDDLSRWFVLSPAETKSAGPDGVSGTYDDGLPATYEEFFILCDYIAQDGNTPMIWNGAAYKDYLGFLMQSLQVDFEGLEQTELFYTYEGLAKNLGEVDSQGNFIPDEEDTLLSLAEGNGYEMYRTEGLYRALQFMEKLIQTSKYQTKLCFNHAYSHLNAQDDFLYAGHDGKTKPAAMLSEGVWWEAEATSTFNSMAKKKGEAFSKQNRNFAWLPLPKANSDKVGEKSTIIDHSFSLCFMKPNIKEWKKPLVIDFLKFIHSDESLVEFSQVTSTTKAFQYTMTPEQQEVMSPLGRSLYAMQERSDVVYPFASHDYYINNSSRFTMQSLYVAKSGSKDYTYYSEVFHDNKMNAISFFKGMHSYYKSNWF